MRKNKVTFNKKFKFNKKINCFIKNLLFNKNLDLFNYDYSNNHFKNNLTTFFIELYKKKAKLFNMKKLNNIKKLNNFLFQFFVKLRFFFFRFNLIKLLHFIYYKKLIKLVSFFIDAANFIKNFFKFTLQFFNTNIHYLAYLNNLYSNLFYSLSIDLKYADVFFNKKFIINFIRKLKNKKVFFFNFNFILINIKLKKQFLLNQKTLIQLRKWIIGRKKGHFYIQYPFHFFYNKSIIKENPHKKLYFNKFMYFNPTIIFSFFNFFFFKGDYYRLSLLFFQFKLFFINNVYYMDLYKLSLKIKFKDSFNNLFYFVNKISFNVNLQSLFYADMQKWSINNFFIKKNVIFYFIFSSFLKKFINFYSIFNKLQKDYTKKYSWKQRFSYIYRTFKKKRLRPIKRHRKYVINTQYLFKKTLQLFKWQKLKYSFRKKKFRPPFLKSFRFFIAIFASRINYLKKTLIKVLKYNIVPTFYFIKFGKRKLNIDHLKNLPSSKVFFDFKKKLLNYYYNFKKKPVLKITNYFYKWKKRKFKNLKYNEYLKFNKLEKKYFSLFKPIYTKWEDLHFKKIYKLKPFQLALMPKFLKLKKNIEVNYFNFLFYKSWNSLYINNLYYFKNFIKNFKIFNLPIKSNFYKVNLLNLRYNIKPFLNFDFTKFKKGFISISNFNNIQKKFLLLLKFIKNKKIIFNKLKLKSKIIKFKRKVFSVKRIKLFFWIYYYFFIYYFFFSKFFIIKNYFWIDYFFLWLSDPEFLLFKDFTITNKFVIAFLNNYIQKQILSYLDNINMINNFCFLCSNFSFFFYKQWQKEDHKSFFFKRKIFFTRYSKKRKWRFFNYRKNKYNLNKVKYCSIMRLFDYKFK